MWARVPPLYAALCLFYAALEWRASPLPPALRSLVQIRVSQPAGSQDCRVHPSAAEAYRLRAVTWRLATRHAFELAIDLAHEVVSSERDRQVGLR